MSTRVGRLPLRVRLVSGFAVAMMLLLSAAGVVIYWRVEYALDRGLDVELERATATVTPLVDGSGRVSSAVAADATGTAWQVLGADGVVLDHGGGAPAAALVSSTILATVGSGTLVTELGDLLPAADRPYRLQVSSAEGPGGQFVLVALRRDHRDEALRELVLQLALTGLGALTIASLVGDRLARAALRPVERYRRRAEEVAAGAGDGLRLDVPPDRDDEVTRLGHTLNEMLGALEESLDHERRFVKDASHELRTPLTLLQSRIQLARRRPRSPTEHETVLDELAVDVTRMVGLVDHLLAMGVTPLTHDPADARQVVSAEIARRRVAAPDLDLSVELPAGPLPVRIGSLTLERVLTNVLDNALLHGRPPVQVRVSGAGSWVVVSVRDDGPGMPADLLARATGRFTRSDEARSRPGSGLGLALVDQVVAAAGGELRLCCAGSHARHGQLHPLPCDHDDAMVVTVIMPAAP